MQYGKLSVRQFITEVRRGNINLQEFYATLFPKLRALNKDYHFFTTLSQKKAVASLPHINKAHALAGLPISVKDNICTEGIPSSAGSKILEGYIPPFDATAVARTKERGGVVIGKTQMDEFGFGTFSTNSGYSVPRNPIDPSRTCGGSSGGAAGLVRVLNFPHAALAVSTGGSISAPASFTGVIGLTPTYGLVSRWGLIDYANSLDKIGVLARDIDTAALLLDSMHGFDAKDFTSLKTLKQKYTKKRKRGKLRIGIPKEYFQGVDPSVRKQVKNAVGFLEDHGCKVKEVSLPNTKYALAAYYIIATAEASTNLARYCGMRYGPGPDVAGSSFNEYFTKTRTSLLGSEAKRRIILGTYARMAGFHNKYYQKAFRVRTLVIQDFEKVFRGTNAVDVLVAPTMPTIAPKFSEIKKLTPLDHYKMDILTVGPNLAGIPHLSIPWGTVKDMPVGVHLIGSHLGEAKILEAGRILEEGMRPLRSS